MDQIEAWLESPSLVLLAETEGHWPELRSALEQGRITGPQIHNPESPRSAAIMACMSCGRPTTTLAAGRRLQSSIR